jgi:hypothetical protein
MRTEHPCGTDPAYRRHLRRNETCPTCRPNKKPALKPCGTHAAYKRGCRCQPCTAAFHTYRADHRAATGTKQRLTEAEYIDEIVFLLNCGEGEHAILRALGTSQDAIERRLHRAKRRDLINRIFEWKLAA